MNQYSHNQGVRFLLVIYLVISTDDVIATSSSNCFCGYLHDNGCCNFEKESRQLVATAVVKLHDLVSPRQLVIVRDTKAIEKVRCISVREMCLY